MLDIHDIRASHNMPVAYLVIREPYSYKVPMFRNVNAVYAVNAMCEKKDPEKKVPYQLTRSVVLY